MHRSQAGRNKISQFGQYHGYSEAIFPVSSSLDSYRAVNYRGGVYNTTLGTLFSQSTGTLETLATSVDGDESGALLAQARAERSGATVGEKAAEVIKRYPFRCRQL
jgi:hypothetical protein